MLLLLVVIVVVVVVRRSGTRIARIVRGIKMNAKNGSERVREWSESMESGRSGWLVATKMAEKKKNKKRPVT